MAKSHFNRGFSLALLPWNLEAIEMKLAEPKAPASWIYAARSWRTHGRGRARRGSPVLELPVNRTFPCAMMWTWGWCVRVTPRSFSRFVPSALVPPRRNEQDS